MKDIRERILRKAFNLFSKKGFEGTKMDDIANAVGINKATIYYYFESKKSLYQEVLYRRMSEFYMKVVEVVDELGDTPQEMVTHLVDLYFDFFLKNQTLWRLYLREICNGGKYLRDVIKRLVRENPLFKKGGMPVKLEEMGVTEGLESDGLHVWLNVLGMIFVHFLFYPFVEEVTGVKVDDEFVENRKKSVLEFLERAIWR